ncbi:MAG: hypothetical protein V1790_01625, partial [Planctomycetota bacterium]
MKIPVAHESLKSGDPCPECQKGKVYEVAQPGVLVRITGQAPVRAKVYELQKLRCNLCGKVFFVAAWSYSNCPFALATPTERTEAILGGMVEAFDFFGCAPHEVWWDSAHRRKPSMPIGSFNTPSVWPNGMSGMRRRWRMSITMTPSGR